MLDETRNYVLSGVWNRHQELVDEARRLHHANRAARAAKANRRSPTLRASRRGAATWASPPTLPGTPRGNRGGRTGQGRRASNASPAWRAAAARVGTSLVAVGKRLEHYAWRESDRN